MFDRVKLNSILEDYKKSFVSDWWNKEKYKWQAIKCFQDNWDINAANFSDMLEKSFAKTENLLASNYYFPKRMIIEFAKIAPDNVRRMFIDLFDETKDVYERINSFKEHSALLLKEYKNEANNHFQNENSITTYLWLRYPDKYYIYKISEVREVAEKLNSNYLFKKGAYNENIYNFFKFYDEICKELKHDKEIVNMLESQLTDDCYPDKGLKTLTVDIGFYISRHNPNITKSDNLPANRDILINNLLYFLNNSFKIRDNSSSASQNPIIGKYREFSYKAKFGAGKFSKVTWFAFLAYAQDIQKGIYPVILYNTETSKNNFEICYGISATNKPNVSWSDDFIAGLPHSKTKKYAESIVFKSYTINDINDFRNNQESILYAIDKILEDFSSIFIKNNLNKEIDLHNLSDIVKNLYWYQAIGLSMYLNGKNKSYKVLEIQKQPIVAEYIKHKNVNAVYSAIIGQLQIHTSNDSKFVNYTKKTPPAIFDKNENAEWYLTEFGIKYIESELAEYIKKLNNPELYAAKRETVHYWMLSAGENAIWWNDFRENSIIAIDWSSYNLGDLTQYKSKLEIKDKLKEYNSQSSNKNNALCCWQFANEMQEGDIVYIKGKQTQILGRGIVKSQYIYDDTRSECKHTRAVEWTHTEERESETKWAIKTLTDITQYTEDVEKLENLFNIEIEEQTETFDQYTEEDFINDVFIDKSQYEILRNLLLNKKNIILQGAPGVGKTYAAKRLAYSILGEKDTNKVKIIQFHQSYGYEDFIMGYRPKENGFELVNGPFYKFCKNAEENPDDKFFFIIDEINRGKLSKIFGELLMLIEPDKRGQSLRLLYRDEEFSVPENLYIIGMMNTADRSIAMIDYALRRRFAFYDFKPAFETESFIRYKEKFNNKKYNALIDEITKLNKEISNDCSLGSGFQIGHSYFCNNKEINDEWLNSVVDYEIIPLLKEYWFDEQSKIETWTNNLKNAVK